MIVGELESMSEIQAKTFSAACAELLIRFFATDIPPETISRDILRAIVDTLWNSTALEVGYAGDAASDSERLHSVLLGDNAEEVGRGSCPSPGSTMPYKRSAVTTVAEMSWWPENYTKPHILLCSPGRSRISYRA
jgi:hypothetical protein